MLKCAATVTVRTVWQRSDSRATAVMKPAVTHGCCIIFCKHIVLKESRKQLHCRASQATESDSDDISLLKNAGSIGVATAISKVLGLMRELVLAAVFGVGPVIDAFGYSSILPGFFLAILGGINGPLHLTITAALSKLSEEEGKELVQKISAAAFLVSLSLSIGVCAFASQIIDFSAPGLRTTNSGDLNRKIATSQLRLMSPTLVLASLIGIGYGRLSAVGVYGIPSLSPALSSITVITFATIYCLTSRSMKSQNMMTGGIVLASAFTLGAFFQWWAQEYKSRAKSYEIFRSLNWKNFFTDEAIREVVSLVIPATVGSGMLQIATYTDLYFASYFPHAAASLGYANLLVMAPLGIISSAVLIPMLPLFSRLSQPSQVQELKLRIREYLQLCMTMTLPMTAIMLPLAKPIVRVVFQRYAFGASAADSVTPLVICYLSGSTFYLIRDFLVRIFYALGDAKSPFFVSAAAIVANFILDWLLITVGGFGAKGLVMSTTMVNFLSAACLLLLLSRRLLGLKIKECLWSCASLCASAAITAIITSLSYAVLYAVFCTRTVDRFWSVEIMLIILSSSMGSACFFLLLLRHNREVVKLLMR